MQVGPLSENSSRSKGSQVVGAGLWEQGGACSVLQLRWWARGLGRRDVCKVWRTWLTWPPSPGKLDRGVKNEPGRAGARKARESKSNLDPDLKGIRLRGARHLSILSTACHAGLASPVSREGMLRLLGADPTPLNVTLCGAGGWGDLLQ